MDEGAITGAEGGISSGIGLSLRLDNRDNILNPQSGEYLATSPLYFSNLTGSNFSFTLLEVDLRKYCKAPLKSIVALQTFTQLAFGSPPFRMMALLGGENVMRGYYTGRYRDNHLLAAQAEWRLPIYWILGQLFFSVQVMFFIMSLIFQFLTSSRAMAWDYE